MQSRRRQALSPSPGRRRRDHKGQPPLASTNPSNPAAWVIAPYSGARLPSPATPLGRSLIAVLAARHLAALHRRLAQIGATSDPTVLEHLDGLHYACASTASTVRSRHGTSDGTLPAR